MGNSLGRRISVGIGVGVASPDRLILGRRSPWRQEGLIFVQRPIAIMVRYQLRYPSILVFCAIGVFSLNNSEVDAYLMAVFGVLGYVFTRLGCEPAPMRLAFNQSPLIEEYLRRAMLLSRGNPWVFVQRPISATLLRKCSENARSPRATALYVPVPSASARPWDTS